MIDKQLKAMMDKKGLTLEKLSMLSNVPIETIRNIIYRRARNPRVDTLLALSRTLDVSMESLMGESPREEEEQLLFAIVKAESMERNLYVQSQKLKRSGRQE